MIFYLVLILSVALPIVFQRSFIYLTNRIPRHNLPARSFLLPDPEDVFVDDHVHVAVFNGGRKNVIVYFHGNGGSVQDTYWHLGNLYATSQSTIVAVEYRGYGKSKSEGPTEALIVADSCKATGYVINRFGGSNIILMGVSLGTGVALQVFKEFKASIVGMILENPYTSVPELIPRPFRWFMFDQWNSAFIMPSVNVPILVLTSEKDEVIPPHMSTQLLNSCTCHHKSQVILDGSNHGNAGSHPFYQQAIRTFLDDIEQ